MEFLKNKKTILFEILFLFLLSLVPLLWFDSGKVVVGLDSGYAIDHLQYFLQRSFTWFAPHNFGVDMSIEIGAVIFSLIPALVTLIGLPDFQVQKVVFVFWFFILSLSMYCLTSYVFPKRDQWGIRILGVILYIFNLHIYSFWLQGEQAIFASYALLPLILLVLFRFVDEKTTLLKYAIYLNIVYFLFSSGGIRGVSLVGSTLACFSFVFLYFFIVNLKHSRLAFVKRFSSLLLVSLIIFIFVNMYFLLPFLASFAMQYGNQVNIAGGVGGAVEWARSISIHTSLINIFRLTGDNNWYDKNFLWSYSYLTNWGLISISFIFPILAYTSVLLVKVKKEKVLIYFFALLSLLAIFLSAGTHSPLGGLYVFLMEKVPGFATFRSPYYKFMPLVYLSYAFLISASVYYLIEKYNKNKKNLIYSLVILGVLFYNYPFFTKSNFVFDFPFRSMMKVPDYVKELPKDEKIDPKYRTLVVPPSSYFANLQAFKWGYWAGYPIYSLVSDKQFITNDAFGFQKNEDDVINAFYSALRNEQFDQFKILSNKTATKYILVTRDFAYDYDKSITENPEIYNQILNKNDKIFKKVLTKGEWDLYEINDTSPEIIRVIDSLASISEKTDLANASSAITTDFVSEKDISNVRLPINGRFTSINCLSCDVLDQGLSSDIFVPRIMPKSFFYPYKIKREKNNLSKINDKEEKLNYLLGLSLKRVNEIQTIDVKSDSYDEWINSVNLWKSNWNEINKIYLENYNNEQNLVILKRISDYADLEANIINSKLDLTNIEPENKLGNSILESLSQINSINKSTQQVLNFAKWKGKYVYDVSEVNQKIYINKTTLQKKSDGEVLYPISYEINGETIEYSPEDKFIKIPEKNDGKLILNFNLPNLFADVKNINYIVKGESRKCLSSRVPEYSGYKKYFITADLIKDKEGEVYIIRKFSTLKNQSISNVNDKSLTSSTATYKYPSPKSNGISIKFSGNLKDESVDILFCSNQDNIPEEVFDKIVVNEISKPSLYEYEIGNANANSLPKITYEKINPTKYSVKINDAKQPFVLNFSERFSTIWGLKVNGEKNNTHIMLNGFSNGWYIDKKGSYEIIIYFNNQKLFKVGLIISLITFLIISAYLIWDFLKKNDRK